MKFWSYLWGFETKTRPIPGHGRWWFWSYLWGFETWQPLSEWVLVIVVLELPMRVWNRAFPYNDRVAYHRFGVTYEGLKQSGGGRCWATPGFWSYLWGFETALRQVVLCILSFVLELPMRVWNSAWNEVTVVPGFVFWSYLWGFETAVWQHLTCRKPRVLELPMRVWNRQYLIIVSTHWIVLELPMRVWNQ